MSILPNSEITRLEKFTEQNDFCRNNYKPTAALVTIFLGKFMTISQTMKARASKATRMIKFLLMLGHKMCFNDLTGSESQLNEVSGRLLI